MGGWRKCSQWSVVSCQWVSVGSCSDVAISAIWVSMRSNFEKLQVYQLSEKVADQIWTLVLGWDSFARKTESDLSVPHAVLLTKQNIFSDALIAENF